MRYGTAILLILALFIMLLSCRREVRAYLDVERTQVLVPFGMGPYSVASSCLYLDAVKVSNLVGMKKRTIRNYAGGMRFPKEGPVYLSDLLADNSGAFKFMVKIPDEPEYYGKEAGSVVPYTGFIIYPASSNNMNMDYKVSPDYPVLPKMQLPGEVPDFENPGSKYPLIVFSHGWTADPLVHMPEIIKIASYGYVVIALFHGDNRWDGRNTLRQKFLFRPLSIKYAIDELSQNSAFKEHIDFGKIGAVGVSAGGCTVFSLLGAKFGGIFDAGDFRIKASVGHWPVLGGGWWGSKDIWGKDFQGITNMRNPFMAISGSKDDIAPWKVSKQVLSSAPGVKYLIKLEGERHGVSSGAQKKAMTWTMLFLDSYIKGDSNSLKLLGSLKSVKGVKPQDKLIDIDQDDGDEN